MTSITDAATANLGLQGGKYAWLKAHVGTLAIAFAIIFAASVWGFVNSAAFAVFFTLFVGFLFFFALSVGFFGGEGGGNAFMGLLFFFVSLALLYFAIWGRWRSSNCLTAPARLPRPGHDSLALVDRLRLRRRLRHDDRPHSPVVEGRGGGGADRGSRSGLAARTEAMLADIENTSAVGEKP